MLVIFVRTTELDIVGLMTQEGLIIGLDFKEYFLFHCDVDIDLI